MLEKKLKERLKFLPSYLENNSKDIIKKNEHKKEDKTQASKLIKGVEEFYR